ncbi:bacteriohopanetetrol glucosamine biosynthesis glycosyltransferase HpnI [Geomonas sp. RF6]|uniref:bacteriohopanetetrol glucosamine biosynthesis glycosyltransferase HpnI n=1 Tax=Geomonas sp. RF6 TaxID=2897342 RepID=UPI001E3319B3|nr:bacteriohopanetetrol glucosamine biosynthesis glycosyltransferase HpnI [Geomonas sp. RF6]UFS71354.1 bacteriohopanetetrol glucosamine biosynthesis glycosyltransferase HpnI [Geomonas sp. RF6]
MLQELLPFLICAPATAYAAITYFCGRSFFGADPALPPFTPPVSILKPVKGMDGESFQNFASFCCQDYPAYQIVFAVASDSDPVIPVIKEVMAAFPETDIELVVDGAIHGANYKVCNLMHAFAAAKHDFLIVCDSDIRVRKTYLREVCAPFADPQVGLVTSLYRTSGVAGAGCAIEALGFSCEMVPNVMAALKLEGLSFALGASMAVRRDALRKIGGFEALVDYLADDYQLGHMIFKAGYRLELSPFYVESIMKGEKVPEVLSRQLRWARTMRVSRPGGYFASGITFPFPAALLALLISGFSAGGICAAAFLYAVRAATCLSYSRSFVRDKLLPRWLWLLPIRDGFSFAVWGLSFLGNRVRWRGHLFELSPGGKIAEIAE